MERESPEKGTFPLNESKAADEELFVLREGALKRNLSAELVKGS